MKPVPVMLLGVLVAKKRYPLQKYLYVLLIVFGVVLFMYKEPSKQAVQSNEIFGIGEFLLVKILFFLSSIEIFSLKLVCLACIRWSDRWNSR